MKTSAVAIGSKRIDCGAASVASTEVQEQNRLMIQPQLLPQTEQQAVSESDQEVRSRAHPCHYPPSVDVRPRASRNDSTGSDTV